MLRPLSICLAVIIASVHLLSCGSSTEEPTTAPATKNAAETSGPAGQKPDSTPADTLGMSATLTCHKVDTSPKALLKSQTFAIDFEPFRNSCFVTSHDPEFTDPPLNAELSVFRDGKRLEVFRGDFPVTMGHPVNGEPKVSLPPGCWVEAVAFQDVNADHLTDVIVVAKCGAKHGDFNENLVFLNNSKFLVTRQDSNYPLSEFTTIKEIVEYIKKNPKPFSLIVDAANSNSKP